MNFSIKEDHMKRSQKSKAILVMVLGFLVGFLTVLSMNSSAQQGPGVPRISPEELKHLIETKAAVVIVDTQPKGAYEIGHIKGAINFPWAMDIKSPDKLPKDKTLVLYCDCAHEEDSMDTAKQLRDKWGYTKMELLTGGWSGWQKLGYPTEKTKGK